MLPCVILAGINRSMLTNGPTTLNPGIPQLLRRELERRCAKNARYSLRAFARSVGLSHSMFSLVLTGRRELSAKAARRLLDTCTWEPAERLLLEQYTRRLRGQSVVVPEASADASFRDLELDQFELISDWYHFAILSLMELPNAKFSAKWIAGRLNISELRAAAAMERLVRQGLVKKVGGKHRQTGLPLKVENRRSTEATRKYHRQLLERAVESLENDSFEERDFSAITMAIAPGQVAYARERINTFRRELCRELESRGTAEQVYQLSVQIFPVSKPGSQTLEKKQ